MTIFLSRSFIIDATVESSKSILSRPITKSEENGTGWISLFDGETEILHIYVSDEDNPKPELELLRQGIDLATVYRIASALETKYGKHIDIKIT